MQTYLLKLARSGEEGEKVFLLLQSGFRFHTTQVHITDSLLLQYFAPDAHVWPQCRRVGKHQHCAGLIFTSHAIVATIGRQRNI